MATRGYLTGTLMLVVLSTFACARDDESPSAAAATKSEDAGMREDPAPSTPARGLADGIVGKPCAEASECGTGSCLTTLQVVNTPYPGGYCTSACGANDECGKGGICAASPLPGRRGSCYLGCADDAACREGYVCRVVSEVGRCVPGQKPLESGIVGSACTSPSDCGGAECVSSIGDLNAPDGYCSQSCAIHSDCGPDGRCINGINIVTINSGRCYRACDVDQPCREGYECRTFSGVEGYPGVCVP